MRDWKKYEMVEVYHLSPHLKPTYEGLKVWDINRHLAHRYYLKPTYEGLKGRRAITIARTDIDLKPTYEGLKVECAFRGLTFNIDYLKPTYEGLKVMYVVQRIGVHVI